MKGGLGVINLETHNNSLLFKLLNKFYTKIYIPWVHLVWNNYYANGRILVSSKKAHFGGETLSKSSPNLKVWLQQ
jgi:hypothetical protein